MDQLTWFKSSYSSHNGACVECAHSPDGGMAVRDSKHPAMVALSFSREAWHEFLVRASTVSG
jgi:hypothetical protein